METREEQAVSRETREDRVPRSGMLNASRGKRKIKLRRQHYLRQKRVLESLWSTFQEE